jgi:hypothetical protein
MPTSGFLPKFSLHFSPIHAIFLAHLFLLYLIGMIFVEDHKLRIKFFLNLHSGGWNQGPLDTAATNGLLCQPRVIMIMEKSVE